MNDAFAWLGQIMVWFGQWVPRWVVVDTTEAAIKYVRGQPRLCEGGAIHWYWPVVTKWVQHPVARQTDRLETQTMETVDGKTFIVAGIITYSVTDLMAFATRTFSPLALVQELSASAIHDICCEFTWEALQREQMRGTLKTKLKNEAARQLRDYGVEVIKVQLTSLARARVLKISQSTASEET